MDCGCPEYDVVIVRKVSMDAEYVQTTYEQVRSQLRTGDVVVTADQSFVSWVVRRITCSEASHVGMVYKTDNDVVHLMEAAKVGRLRGEVTVTRLSERIKEYTKNKGRIWLLMLSDTSRDALDEQCCVDELNKQKGTPYDIWQAILSPWDIIRKKCSKRLFCSESVAKAFAASGVLPSGYNYSSATPSDVVAFGIYLQPYCQILGDPRPLHEFNTTSLDSQYRSSWNFPLLETIDGNAT